METQELRELRPPILENSGGTQGAPPSDVRHKIKDCREIVENDLQREREREKTEKKVQKKKVYHPKVH